LNDERISVRIPEACRLIGISRSKLYELIEAGEIQTAKVGASRLILVSSLRTFVESRAE
jgi:excisionase family DNA binding protein